jgi:hypothetical protein
MKSFVAAALILVFATVSLNAFAQERTSREALQQQVQVGEEPSKADALTVALVAALATVLGGSVVGLANYVISKRQLSRSGARLMMDLQILEKARSLQLESSLMKAIEARVRLTLDWHTRHAIGDVEATKH